MIQKLEITRRFREINPVDPVKYDFVLRRLGIRKDRHIPRMFSPDSFGA
jgi:hypothetical protein